MPMLDPQKLGLEACTCGRVAIKKHCPKCGCYTCDARAAFHVTRPTSTVKLTYTRRDIRLLGGEQKLLAEGCTIDRIYVCRSCAYEFDTLEWGPAVCEAPTYESGTAHRQRAHREEVQQALRRLTDDQSTRIKQDIFSGDPQKRMEAQRKLYEGIVVKKDK